MLYSVGFFVYLCRYKAVFEQAQAIYALAYVNLL